jgi:hypothetical protein
VRLLADEGVDAAVVARLRSDGHDVVYVAELLPGITDDAAQVIGEHGSEMPGAFTVLSAGLVRIRPPL